MAGRRTKCTPERIAAICESISIGCTRKRAAVAAGVSEVTYYAWASKGEAERKRLQQKGARPRQSQAIYVEFLKAIEEAEATAEQIHVARIADSGPEGSKWILTRRFPNEWGNKTQTQLTGKNEGPIEIENVGPTDEDRIARTMALLDRARERRDRGADG
jgi:hypothetical protein